MVESSIYTFTSAYFTRDGRCILLLCYFAYHVNCLGTCIMAVIAVSIVHTSTTTTTTTVEPGHSGSIQVEKKGGG